MMIVYDENFISKLREILTYISMDSRNRANDFKKELKTEIENLAVFPYKFRKSRWFDNKSIRDLIFKGYTIPYFVHDDKIVILDIFKWTQ